MLLKTVTYYQGEKNIEYNWYQIITNDTLDRNLYKNFLMNTTAMRTQAALP